MTAAATASTADDTALPRLRGSDLLTHSRLSCRKTCPRKHYYQYELGIRPIQVARPLRMGDAVHQGLDLRAQGLSVDEAILGAVKGYEEVPEWCNTDELFFDWCIEREKVARLLSGYFWYWSEDRDQVTEVLETEQRFELPIRNPETNAITTSFKLGGKIDKIVRLRDGRTALMEHKTCSEDLSPESTYWKRLRIDQQISTYYIAAADKGKPVETVLYDVIRKPLIGPLSIPLLDDDGVKIVLDAQGNRVRTKDGKKWRESGDQSQGFTLQTRRQTPTEYGDRLTADIAANPEFYFARREIPRLDADLIEFRFELWQMQQEMRAAQRAGRHFRNTSACTFFNKPCEYLDICHTGAELTDGHVPAGFERIGDVHPELNEDPE